MLVKKLEAPRCQKLSRHANKERLKKALRVKARLFICLMEKLFFANFGFGRELLGRLDIRLHCASGFFG